MKKVLAFVICIALMITLCSCQSKSERWQEQYDLGLRYLEEGNYSEAVIAFSAAIEIDPNQAAAYAGRGDANMGCANFEAAISDYRSAVEKQPEPENYMRLANGYIAEEDEESAAEVLEEIPDEIITPEIEELIELILHLSRFEGTILAWGENYQDTPVPGAIVTLRNVESGNVLLSYLADANGKYGGFALPGAYEFFVHADGYKPVAVQQAIGQDETVEVEPIYLLSQEEEGTGTIQGTLFDEVTEEPIPNAQIQIIPLWSQNEEENTAGISAVSDEEGKFTISNQPVGYYTLSVRRDEYYSKEINIVVSSQYTEDWKMTLMPIHVHTWVEANYQSPETCSGCGETRGEPLEPYFEGAGFSYTEMQPGGSYSFEVSSYYDLSVKGTCQVVVTDYTIIKSDETHTAKDGYEWRIATFDFEFHDSFQFTQYCFDYYNGDMDLLEDMNDGDNKIFSINYNGNETEVCFLRERLDNGEWTYDSNGNPIATHYILRFSCQVPEGYDGAIKFFVDAEINEQAETFEELFALCTPENYLVFRFD